MVGLWKLLGRRGVLRAKILHVEAINEDTTEFPGGKGTKQKTFHGGSMDIFWSCTVNFNRVMGFQTSTAFYKQIGTDF